MSKIVLLEIIFCWFLMWLNRMRKKNLPGMLPIIDFEKAFDSLEWNFLFKALARCFKNGLILFTLTSQAVLWTMLTLQTFSSSTEAFDKVAHCQGFFLFQQLRCLPKRSEKTKTPWFKNQRHWIKTKYICRWPYSYYKGWVFSQPLIQSLNSFRSGP